MKHVPIFYGSHSNAIQLGILLIIEAAISTLGIINMNSKRLLYHLIPNLSLADTPRAIP